MYNKLTIQETENQRVFFTSDTHWCHDRDFILDKRGFKTIKEHDDTLIKLWNEKVGKNDYVIHCGDFLVGAGQNSLSKFLEIANKLNGKVLYLWGNHNAGVKPHYQNLVSEKLGNDAEEIYPLRFYTANGYFEYRGYNLLLRVVEDSPKMIDKSHYFFCSHFAHRLWIDSHKGHVNHVSGHSHGSDSESQPQFKDVKRLDVGIENFQAPLSVEEIMRIFNKKRIKNIDHHKKSTNPSF